MQASVYLDYNATAPILSEAADAMTGAMQDVGNASSVHNFGRRARQRIENARNEVAQLIGAKPSEIIFTSGGTEANNLALYGLGAPVQVITCATEHDSVLNAASGKTVLSVDHNGQIDLDELDRALTADEPALVSIMAANNETGIIHNIEQIAEIAHARGALIHTDMVQAAGRLPMTVANIDMATISSHKLGGPQGIGALFVAEHVKLAAQLRGGGQERGHRAGTENVAAIAGFGAAARVAAAKKESEQERLSKLRNSLEQEALSKVPDTVIVGRDAPRLANTSCLALPGVKAETQVMMLDLDGIAVSAGSACSSGKVKASHVLTAMGLPDNIAASAIRISLGHLTTKEHVDRFIEAWTKMAQRTYKAGTNEAA